MILVHESLYLKHYMVGGVELPYIGKRSIT